MARYIDVEPLEDKLKEHIRKTESELMLGALSTFLRVLDITPTADAVPVVRCKDCKHWQPSEYGVVEQPYCKHLGYKEETGLDIQIGNENDYCSFGERKDNEID